MAYGTTKEKKAQKRQMAKKQAEGTKQEVDDDPPSPKETKAPPKPRKKTEGKALTESQKADLRKHMAEHSEVKDMDSGQKKSHRMKMMVRMRKGMTISEAHKDIM